MPTFSSYNYNFSNPIKYSDPTGMAPEIVTGTDPDPPATTVLSEVNVQGGKSGSLKAEGIKEPNINITHSANLGSQSGATSNPYDISNGVDSHILFDDEGKYTLALPTNFGSWDKLGSDGRQWIGCMYCHGNNGAYRTVAYNSKQRALGLLGAAILQSGAHKIMFMRSYLPFTRS